MNKTYLKLSIEEVSAGLGKMVSAKPRFLRQPLCAKTLVQARVIGKSSSLGWAEGWYKLLGEVPSLAVLCSPANARGLAAYPNMCFSFSVSATEMLGC